jgi:hypothetical protein
MKVCQDPERSQSILQLNPIYISKSIANILCNAAESVPKDLERAGQDVNVQLLVTKQCEHLNGILSVHK